MLAGIPRTVCAFDCTPILTVSMPVDFKYSDRAFERLLYVQMSLSILRDWLCGTILSRG